MKKFFAICALVALIGCDANDRLIKAAKEEEKKTINVAGKKEPAPPIGITEPMVLVEGRWVFAKDEGKTWEVKCGKDGCKPRLIK